MPGAVRGQPEPRTSSSHLENPDSKSPIPIGLLPFQRGFERSDAQVRKVNRWHARHSLGTKTACLAAPSVCSSISSCTRSAISERSFMVCSNQRDCGQSRALQRRKVASGRSVYLSAATFRHDATTIRPS